MKRGKRRINLIKKSKEGIPVEGTNLKLVWSKWDKRRPYPNLAVVTGKKNHHRFICKEKGKNIKLEICIMPWF